jgi:hypothetical protein
MRSEKLLAHLLNHLLQRTFAPQWQLVQHNTTSTSCEATSYNKELMKVSKHSMSQLMMLSSNKCQSLAVQLFVKNILQKPIRIWL